LPANSRWILDDERSGGRAMSARLAPAGRQIMIPSRASVG
jgi:hypothetical protein